MSILSCSQSDFFTGVNSESISDKILRKAKGKYRYLNTVLVHIAENYNIESISQEDKNSPIIIRYTPKIYTTSRYYQHELRISEEHLLYFLK